MTELRIADGDYVCPGGSAERLTGSGALIQRVLYRLTARRGMFPFLPTLGSTLYRLGAAPPNERASAAEAAVREALAEEAELSVDRVTLSDMGGGQYHLHVDGTWSGENLTASVILR